MNLAIVGYREFEDYIRFQNIIHKVLDTWNNPPIKCIVSGGAKGVDKLAERYAKDNALELIIFLPEWTKYGKRAGPIRNLLIVKESSHVIALPSRKSIGTLDTIRKARNAKKLLHVEYID